MRMHRLLKAFFAVALASTACSAKNDSNVVDSTINTTSSAIAIANLDQQIHQAGNEDRRRRNYCSSGRGFWLTTKPWIGRAHLVRDDTRQAGSSCYALELAPQCTDSRMLLPTLRQRSALEQNRTRLLRYVHPSLSRLDVQRK